MEKTEEINAMVEEMSVEKVQPEVVERLERANIDVQIATAHAYPRSIEKFHKRAIDMIASDLDTAISCIYKRPVGDGKIAEGKSVRLAEIVGASYGNLRVGAMITEQTERYVKARGFAHDLESNFASTSEVIESTVTKEGKPFSERMRIVVAKACVAKARRDATFQVVPSAICKRLEETAKAVMLKDVKSLDERKAMAKKWLEAIKVEEDRAFKVLEVNGWADIGDEHLVTLAGLKTAINDGDVKLIEAFPLIENKLENTVKNNKSK